MMRIFASIFATFLIFSHASANVNLNCDDQMNPWTPFGSFIECLTRRVVNEEPGQIVTSISTHRHEDDYKSVYIYQSPDCHYIPRGITEMFPKIFVFVAAHTGIKSVSKEDLEQFRNLRGFYIDHSKLTVIPKDLFIYTPNLKEVSIVDNYIKHVAPNVFEPLTKLTSFAFADNDCTYGNAKDREAVERLFKKIENECFDDTILEPSTIEPEIDVPDTSSNLQTVKCLVVMSSLVIVTVV